jgi:hypothetical protein
MIAVTLLALSAGACKMTGQIDKADLKESSSGGECKDIGSSRAVMRCNNNAVEFCSSYTDYKFKETQKCPKGKTCFIAEDGNGGGCK